MLCPLAAVTGAGGAMGWKLLLEANKAASGAPDDQLRAPFETLFGDLAAPGGFAPGTVSLVGEGTLSHLRTRPDYPVTASNGPAPKRPPAPRVPGPSTKQAAGRRATD